MAGAVHGHRDVGQPVASVHEQRAAFHATPPLSWMADISGSAPSEPDSAALSQGNEAGDRVRVNPDDSPLDRPYARAFSQTVPVCPDAGHDRAGTLTAA